MTALVLRATRLDVDQGPFLVPFLVPRCRSIKPNAQYRESERLLSLKRDVDSCGKEVEAKNVSGQMRRPKQHRFKEVQTETLNQKLQKRWKICQGLQRIPGQRFSGTICVPGF